MSSLKCPECGHPGTGVLVTAENKTNTVVRRRRECPRCGYRFTTRELYALDAIQALEAQVSALEAEKTKLSNTSLMKFKVLVDQLQDIYYKINDLITEESQHDKETGAKMAGALRKLVEGWRP